MYRLSQADDEWKAMTKEKIETATAEYLSDVEERRAGVDGADNEHTREDLQRYYAIACNQYAWLVGNTFGDHQEAVKLSQESVKIASSSCPQAEPLPAFSTRSVALFMAPVIWPMPSNINRWPPRLALIRAKFAGSSNSSKPKPRNVGRIL